MVTPRGGGVGGIDVLSCGYTWLGGEGIDILSCSYHLCLGIPLWLPTRREFIRGQKKPEEENRWQGSGWINNS